jgi:hypothetical protein
MREDFRTADLGPMLFSELLFDGQDPAFELPNCREALSRGRAVSPGYFEDELVRRDVVARMQPDNFIAASERPNHVAYDFNSAMDRGIFGGATDRRQWRTPSAAFVHPIHHFGP